MAGKNVFSGGKRPFEYWFYVLYIHIYICMYVCMYVFMCMYVCVIERKYWDVVSLLLVH